MEEERHHAGRQRGGPRDRCALRDSDLSDTRATDDADPNDRILWRLEVSAAVPGVDYAASFEVPVYQTAESSQPLTVQELARLDPAGALADYRQPPGSPIALTETATGIEISFPAARNLAAGLGIALFSAFWYGVVVVLSLVDVQIRSYRFRMFGLIPLYRLYLTVFSTTVRVDAAGLAANASRATSRNTDWEDQVRESVEIASARAPMSTMTWPPPTWGEEAPGRQHHRVKRSEWLATRIRGAG